MNATINALTNTLNSIDYVIESKEPTSSDPTWYRVYKSGWIEQGGVANWGSLVTDIPKIQVNFPKEMADTQYYATEMPVRIDMDGKTNGLCAAFVGVFDRHTTYFCVRAYCGGTNEKIQLIQWEVKGQGA